MTKTKLIETGLFELNVKIPNLRPANTKLIIRDMRQTLENCGGLDLLDEFIETVSAEYKEVPAEATV